MRRFALTICCSLFSISGFAQINTDSLKQIIRAGNAPDSVILETWNKLYPQFHARSTDTARYYANLMILLGEDRNHFRIRMSGIMELANASVRDKQFGIADSLYRGMITAYRQSGKEEKTAVVYVNLGLMLMNMGKLDSSEYYLLLSKDRLTGSGDPMHTIVTLNSLGMLYRKQSRYEEAISQYRPAITLSKQVNQLTAEAGARINLAVVFRTIGEKDSALLYLKEGIRLSREAGAREFEATGTSVLASILKDSHQYDQAMDLYARAAEIYTELGDLKRVAGAYSGMAIILKNQGKYAAAIEIYSESLLVFQEHNYPVGMAGTLINIGIEFKRADEFDKALDYYEQGLQIAREYSLYSFEANALSNMGSMYKELKDYELAMQYYLEALAIRERIRDRRVLSSYKNLGALYRAMEKYDQAMVYYERALEEYEGRNAPIEKAGILSNIGTLYKYLDNLPLAIQYKTEALTLYDEHGGNVTTIKNLLRTLYRYHKEAGQPGEALAMYERHIEARDSIENLDNQVALTKLELQQETYQDSLAYVRQLAASDIDFQRRLSNRNYLILGAGGVFLLVLMMVRNRLRGQARERKVELEKQEAEARRLAELDATKNRLYANITHEFRTPLTVIQGMAGKIAEQPEKWMNSGTRMIQRNSKQLLGLVNQMLDLSKLESGHLKLQQVPTEIIQYLLSLIESHESFAESKGIAPRVSSEAEEIICLTDPDRLADIVNNLLSNAIKFTENEGTITVLLQRAETQLRIIVQDTGIGISAENLPHIFDRFYQVDDSQIRSYGGSGVGLALTKELVQLMNGQVSVYSQPGEGTTFTVTLPMIPTAQASGGFSQQLPDGESMVQKTIPTLITAHGGYNHEKHRVLLIEDNQDVAAYISTCLEADYDVIWAPNGKEGLDIALSEVPDLIISDLMMPHKDGFEVTHTLKQDVRTSHIPILLLTAKSDRDSRLAGLKEGADAYLTKPFDEEELLIRLKNLLEIRRQIQQKYVSETVGSSGTSTVLTAPMEDHFISKFRTVIESNLANSQLDVTFLSKELGLSRTPLHNKIKALTGMSTTEYVRFIRLQRAKELLSSTNLNVSEVAYQTGFQNPTYFSRRFKEVMGHTPGETRR